MYLQILSLRITWVDDNKLRVFSSLCNTCHDIALLCNSVWVIGKLKWHARDSLILPMLNIIYVLLGWSVVVQVNSDNASILHSFTFACILIPKLLLVAVFSLATWLYVDWMSSRQSEWCFANWVMNECNKVSNVKECKVWVKEWMNEFSCGHCSDLSLWLHSEVVWLHLFFVTCFQVSGS